MSVLPRIWNDVSSLNREAVAFARRVLEAPPVPRKDILSITVPAPLDAPEKFLRLVQRDRGFLWRSKGSPEQLAGGGAAAALTVQGHDRFRKLARAVPELFARIATYSFDGAPPPPPVLVGGAAFAPNQSSSEAWEEFVDDEFTLPRWGYRRRSDAAAITLTVRRDEVASAVQIETLLDEMQALLDDFNDEPATSLIDRFADQVDVQHVPLDDWWTYIDQIQSAIRSGRYQKIVAARQSTVELEHPLEDTGFMARVYAAYPDCIHYAIRRPRSTFFGATPETLFRKRGLRLETHALAGTTRITDDPASDSSRDGVALQSSRKDLDEHSYVVQKICAELAPLARKIERPDQPETRQVRNLIHLQTPISADLRPETSVFDLLEALHPTPAVGGFPAREAAQWIVDNEPLARGWYSGTMGWIDAQGNGEFAVSIRCGVLRPDRAYVFGGAGIVEASDAAAEYAETAAKMWPILRALGAPTTGLADAAPPPISERHIKIG